MNILIVEDDGSISGKLKSILEQHGHSAKIETNLLNAETAMNSEATYDILFLDLDLPIEDLPSDYWEDAKKSAAGWIFYNIIMSSTKRGQALMTRTVFFTAYAKQFETFCTQDQYRKLNVLPKNTTDIISAAIQHIERLGRQGRRMG